MKQTHLWNVISDRPMRMCASILPTYFVENRRTLPNVLLTSDISAEILQNSVHARFNEQRLRENRINISVQGSRRGSGPYCTIINVLRINKIHTGKPLLI